VTGTHLVHGSFLGYIAEATSREVEGASCRDTSAFFCDCNLGPYSGSFRSPKPLAFSSHRTWHSTAFLALTLILTLTLTLSLTLTHRVQGAISFCRANVGKQQYSSQLSHFLHASGQPFGRTISVSARKHGQNHPDAQSSLIGTGGEPAGSRRTGVPTLQKAATSRQ